MSGTRPLATAGLAAFLALGVLFTTTPAAVADPLYTITEMPTFGGNASRALGINAHGHVVGEAALLDGTLHAFVWRDGVMTDLGALGGAASQAFAINDRGQVVGRAQNAAGRFRTFLYDPLGGGSMRELPTLGGQDPTGLDDGTGFGINNAGQVTGHTRNAAGQLQAFLWQDGVITAIPTPGGSNSRAWDINERGQVSGWGRDAANAIVGYRWGPNAGIELLGTLSPGADVFGIGINDTGLVSGAVVGGLGTPDRLSRAFLWDGTQMIDLGTAPGFEGASANLLNDRGEVVGVLFRFSDDHQRVGDTAFLYRDGQMFNLNDLIAAGTEWYLQRAYSINDQGQIVGWGTLNGQTRGFLLTPTAVPEPSSLTLLSLGGLALVLHRLRWWGNKPRTNN